MPETSPATAAAIVAGAILLQVFIPAIFDVAVALAVAGGGFMLGRATKR